MTDTPPPMQSKKYDPFEEINLTIESWRKELGFKKTWVKNLHPADVLEKHVFPQISDNCMEIVICAAVKAANGQIFRGHRHCDCFGTIRSAGLKIAAGWDDQGFITSKNRFVTREEGRKLQDAAGIPSASEDGYQGNTLYSEDLY